MNLRFKVICWFICFPLLAGFLTNAGFAGGGPEGVFVVVNSLSRDSLTIANHFCELRQIPDVNVLHLEWSGSRDRVDIETFRRRILQPIFAAIDQRRLDSQIDYIVYSSGFPYAIDFRADIRGSLPPEAGREASITGLTFFNVPVRSRETSYVYTAQNRRVNFYDSTWTRGFRSHYGWNSRGQRVNPGGVSYHLSMMLGYTDGRGNTVDEVIRYLRRAAMADCSRPDGTVYLMQNTDVRSSTRHGAFPQVANVLKEMGHKAEVAQGVLPQGEDDVIGAVIGKDLFDWSRADSRILPGAICDNLTSFGGILRSSATQTPLSELLRFGAAGTSGTVVEPFALQAKFPHPWMHVHYARGASLCEAFYQSIASPYQLLIVGDPLCRPWARNPGITVQGVQANEEVSGVRMITPVADLESRIREFQFFIDGRYRHRCRPGDSFRLDSAGLSDGHHEMRVVAVEDSDLESQSRVIVPINVNNHGLKLEYVVKPEVVYENQKVSIYLICSHAQSIHLFQGRRELGVVNQSMAQITLDTSTLGNGPIRLRAIAAGLPENRRVFSSPIEFEVRPASEFAATVVGVGPLRDTD